MTGLLNIGFSVILWASVRGVSLEMRDSGFPFWSEGMQIKGLLSVLTICYKVMCVQHHTDVYVSFYLNFT